MNLTPRDVDYFLAVAKHGRLSDAAKACGVTQPTLTKAIQRLESACALVFFERDARGMHLTAEGRRFHEVAEQLGQSYDEAARTAADLRAQQSGLLRLGTTDGTRTALVPVVLAALLRQRPGLRAVLKIGQSDQLVQAVLEGHLDVVVVPAYGALPAGCDHLKVGEDPLLPVMSVKHPLAKRSQLEPTDLTPYHWIGPARNSAGHKSLCDLCARLQLPEPTLAVEIEYASEAVLSLVQSTTLLAMIPRSLYRTTDQHDLRLISIPEFSIDRTVHWVRRSGTGPSPLTQAFCDLLGSAR